MALHFAHGESQVFTLACMARHSPAPSPTAFLSLTPFQPRLTPYCPLNLLHTLYPGMVLSGPSTRNAPLS